MTDEATLFNGPNGISRVVGTSLQALTDALEKSGSLIKGSSEEITQVSALLENPETSRAASFFLCKAKNCGDVVKDFKSLKHANILIVGCGGIGSSAALLLAGSGVRKFTLADPDVIEKSNLNRQLFWRRIDIGKLKTEALKEAIEDRFDNVETSTINTELNLESIVIMAKQGNYSAIIISADNPETLVPKSEEIANFSGTPVMSGGYLHGACIANCFSGKGDLPPYIAGFHDSIQWKRLPESIMPSFGPTNFNIAALLASGAIMFIASSTFETKGSGIVEWNACQFPLRFHTDNHDHCYQT